MLEYEQEEITYLKSRNIFPGMGQNLGFDALLNLYTKYNKLRSKMTAFLVCAHAFMTTAEVSFHIADLFYLKQRMLKNTKSST